MFFSQWSSSKETKYNVMTHKHLNDIIKGLTLKRASPSFICFISKALHIKDLIDTPLFILMNTLHQGRNFTGPLPFRGKPIQVIREQYRKRGKALLNYNLVVRVILTHFNTKCQGLQYLSHLINARCRTIEKFRGL